VCVCVFVANSQRRESVTRWAPISSVSSVSVLLRRTAVTLAAAVVAAAAWLGSTDTVSAESRVETVSPSPSLNVRACVVCRTFLLL